MAHCFGYVLQLDCWPGKTMSRDQFNSVCERLASTIDPMGQERSRWSAHEGVILNKAIGWARDIFAEQGEFELSEPQEVEGDEHKRASLLRLISNDLRIGTIFFKASGSHLVIWINPNDAEGTILTQVIQPNRELGEVDEAFVRQALFEIMSRLQYFPS
jgi:hypothetical protein